MVGDNEPTKKRCMNKLHSNSDLSFFLYRMQHKIYSLLKYEKLANQLYVLH